MQIKLKKQFKHILFVVCVLTLFIHKVDAQIFPNSQGSMLEPKSADTASMKRDSIEMANKPKKLRAYPKSQLANSIWQMRDTMHQSDSTFSNFHRYSPSSKQIIPSANLGVIGSPEKLLAIQPFKNSGIQIGFQQFPLQGKNPENFEFHKVSQPYTNVKYLQGSGGIIGLDILHTQNLSATWNVTIDYSSILNEDMYTPKVALQQNLNRNTILGSNFTSKSGKYEQQIIFSWNRNRRLENGGLKTDSLFYGPNFQASNSIQQRLFGNYYPNLTNAKSFWAQTDHRFKHRYFFDSSKTFGISQSLRFQKVRFQYTDKTRDTTFYGNEYNFTKNKIADSTSYNLFEHKIGVNFQKTFSSLTANLQVNHVFQYLDYQYDTFLTKVKSYSINTQGFEGIINTKYKSWQIFAEANLFVLGYAQKAFLLNAELKKSFSNEYFLTLRGQISNQPVAQYLSTFTNNHYHFSADSLRATPSNPNFTQQQFASINIVKKGKFLWGNMGLTLGSLQNDYIGINTAIPQKIDIVNYVQFSTDVSLKIGHFIFQEQVFLQLNQNKELANYGLPKLNARSAIFYQNEAFDQALLFRIGIEGTYTSQYMQINYRPDAGAFYWNTNNLNPLGNYPIFDVFISGRIQTVDLFLKYEHLNEWLIVPSVNKRYEQVYKYPIEPYRLRFGFNWRFWN